MAAPNVIPINGRRPVDHQGGIMPSPGEPLPVARVLLNERTQDGHLLLRRWRGDWWGYEGPHWAPIDPESVRQWLYMRLEHAEYEKLNERTQQVEVKPWSPDKSKVDKVLDAISAPALLAREVEAPCWLSTGEPAPGYVPCQNGLVDVTTREIHPTTPDYFGTVGLPIDYDPDAGEPVEWMKFLRTLWPQVDGKDAEEITTLRHWYGYVLSGRLDLQKMLLLLGPPRCGKGTLARILRDLVGQANTSAFTLSSLGQNFGLESSIGKSLSIVGDARLASHGQEAVVERLLSISGQDTLTLDRKNRTAWTGTLNTRVMVLSNENPKFGDASGAIASRFVILKLRKSFLGREDTKLETRLRGEFAGILKWALDGLADLDEKGRIHEPTSHTEAMEEMYDLVSPIKAFLREVCGDSTTDDVVAFAALYREYEVWCKENGRGTKNSAGFSSDLKAAMPDLRTDHRPRDEQGNRMPRHVKGLAVSAEWTTRIKPAGSGW